MKGFHIGQDIVAQHVLDSLRLQNRIHIRQFGWTVADSEERTRRQAVGMVIHDG